MIESTEADRLRAQGHTVTTVGDILGDTNPPSAPFVLATLPGTPQFPEPGIYFGLPDEVYHAIPALSASGTKKIAASPMLYWANSAWLSPKRQREAREDKIHHTLGKAYHCRIMEGREQFDQRFAVELDPADCADALESTDQIKAAIGKFEAETFDRKGNAVTGPVKPVSKVPDQMPDGTEYLRSAVKADWIAQLMALDPEAKIVANLQAAHRAANEGKTFLTAEQFEQLEIAARMIELDPEVKDAFRGGYAEVSLFWYCARTGVPMKARVDYLKPGELVDLKTVGNQREQSIENAIRFEIANYKYAIQPSLYVEGVEAVRNVVRRHAASAIHIEDGYPYPEDDVRAWALKWAAFQGKDTWRWVFQQKGEAPITRGVWYPLDGSTNLVMGEVVRSAKRRLAQFSEVYGVEPWLDTAPCYLIADEDLPTYATEI